MKELFQFRKRVYGSLFKVLQKGKKLVPAYVSLLLVTAAAKLAVPRVYSLFVDEVLIGGDLPLFPYLVLAYGFLYAVSAGAAAGQLGIRNRMCNTLEYSLRLQALEQVIRPGTGKKDHESLGEMKMKIDHDISGLSDFFREQFGFFEMELLLTAGSGVCLLFLNPPLALFGILAVPLTLYLDGQISRRESVLNEENRQNDSRMAAWLYQVIRGWRQIRMFGQEKAQERRYVRFQHKYALYNAKWINYWVTRALIIPKIKNEFLMEFGVYFIGGLLILAGRMTAGELLVFIVYYRQMTDSMTAFSAYQASLKSGMPVYHRAMSVSGDSSREEKDRGGSIESIGPIGQIELRNVSFQYTKASAAMFSNLNGRYKAGDCVGIKGPSGCGKSTLIKLLLGMEEPCGGRIQINGESGANLSQIEPASYYSRISVCMQGAYLFNLSIRENLRYASENASEEAMIRACKKAQIWDEIRRMPKGLDTPVGERGCLLSGGQCQRILLARAFLKEADVYYFDEVTSALDEEKAAAIYREIGELAQEKLVFLVSHDKRADAVCSKFIDFSFS